MALRKMCVAGGCCDLAIEGLAHCDDHEAQRLEKLKQRRSHAQLSVEAQASRKLYRLKSWRRSSRAYLKAHPICVDCWDLGVVEPAEDVDHKVPHKGDPKLFFDRSNWQSLCHACHSRKTASEVFGGGGREIKPI